MLTIPTIQLLTYAFCLWFGLYLVVNRFEKPGIRYAGLGLISYAAGLGLLLLHNVGLNVPQTPPLTRPVVSVLPSIFWLMAAIRLIPDKPYDTRAIKRLLLSCIGIALPLSIILAIANLNFLASVPVAAALLAVYISYTAYQESTMKRPYIVLVVTGIFFALGIGALMLPSAILSDDIVMLAIGFDLAILAYVIGVLDASEDGESMRPDFLRSLGSASLICSIFGVQLIVFSLVPDDADTVLINLLLLTTMSTAIIIHAFWEHLQRLIDAVVLPTSMRSQRIELREVADALPRTDQTANIINMDDDEFARLTRRALSHLGDLSRLATSPLTQLPQIDQHMRANGHDASTLERARILKRILTDSICHLKPDSNDEFGHSDEWRHYNALYFPYVVGLKPYSRRAVHDDLDEASEQALVWFQTYVPERTLYNWQNAAARLIAVHLRETTIS